MNSLRYALKAAQELGLGPLALYARYALGLRTGLFRGRTPAFNWSARPIEEWLRAGMSTRETVLAMLDGGDEGPRFFFDPQADLSDKLQDALAGGEADLLDQAEGILAGSYPMFGSLRADLGFPPPWGTFAPLGEVSDSQEVPLDRHWTSYDIESFPSDPKLLWELSRFGWVFPLARAYRLTGDQRFFLGYWRLVKSWREKNQPNRGPHWISAQEVALRLLALVFSLKAFAPALAETPERAELLVQTIGVHAKRIPPTLDYARSQGNNHLLIESLALHTVGLLFPHMSEAARWRSLGLHWLEYALRSQIFEDGGYVQHSTNYHRMALEAGLWAFRLAEINSAPLSDAAKEALHRSAACLSAVVDPQSGRTPNFGPNDGTRLLPLSACAFDDFRPTIQAASAVLTGRTVLAPGRWDEAHIWLGVAGAPPESHGQSAGHGALDFPQAGLFLARDGSTWGALRCARFTSRPGHSDQLHFDLWWQGCNIALDAGTYLYSGPPPWDNGLAGAGVHNTLLLDEREPMLRAGRFLWLNWAHGSFIGRWKSPQGRLECLAAAHHGYARWNVLHQRTIVRAGERLWLILDELLGEGRRGAALRWLLPDWPWRIEGQQLFLEGKDGGVTVRTEAEGVELGLFRAGQRVAGTADPPSQSTLGWRSGTYASREPGIHLLAQTTGSLPLRILTWFVLGDARREELAIEWRPPIAGRVGFAKARFGDEAISL